MKMKFEISPTMKETILYAISGALTTLVNFATSYLLYNVLGVNENITNAVAWVAAILFAFFSYLTDIFFPSKRNIIDEILIIPNPPA